jgi:aryl-alcohol dehydrogenase-like predicted oxidoreductase
MEHRQLGRTGVSVSKLCLGQLPAADVVLDAALLDRIDEIVPPGTDINPADAGWANPALEPATRRR